MVLLRTLKHRATALWCRIVGHRWDLAVYAGGYIDECRRCLELRGRDA